MAAAQDGEPYEREDDRAKDADDEHQASHALGRAGNVVRALVGRGGVVSNGEEMALGNGFRRGELANVKFVVSEVVVGDAEVLAGGNAKSKGTTGTEFVLAGGDGG